MKYIESDDELSMRGETLLEAITNDRAEGLLPFFVSINCSYFTQFTFRRQFKRVSYLKNLRDQYYVTPY